MVQEATPLDLDVTRFRRFSVFKVDVSSCYRSTPSSRLQACGGLFAMGSKYKMPCQLD